MKEGVEPIEVAETLKRLIQESTDKGLGKGKAFHTKTFLNTVDFHDIADLVLYYVSLQKDMAQISRIETDKFWKLFREVWDRWQKESEKTWDTSRKEEKMSQIAMAWWCRPGPLDGTAGPAETYSLLFPGILQCFTLYQYFSPGDLACSGTATSWKAYKTITIEQRGFPRWRRQSKKRLELALNLAEQVCQAMREAQKATG